MKTKNQKNNLKYHIVGIVFIVFFICGLLFLSTSNIGLYKQKNVSDEINLNYLGNDYLVINLFFQNDGLLSKKVFLEDYIVCDGDKNINVYFNQNSDYNIFYNHNNLKSVEIGSGEILNVEGNINIDKYYLIQKFKNDEFKNNFEVKLYNLDKLEYSNWYNFCKNPVEKDFVKLINVKLNMTKEELFKNE